MGRRCVFLSSSFPPLLHLFPPSSFLSLSLLSLFPPPPLTPAPLSLFAIFNDNIKKTTTADAVCAYDSPKLACVVFPTPETLKQLDALAASKDKIKGGLTIIVNPQWSLKKGSQLISDFGIGPWRVANEAKAASFERAFCLRSARIRGDEARVWFSRAAELDFRAGRFAAAAAAAEREEAGVPSLEPKGPWNVFLVTAAGSMKSSSRLISSGDSEPSYSELEALLRDKGNVATKGWLERAQSEARFLKDSL